MQVTKGLSVQRLQDVDKFNAQAAIVTREPAAPAYGSASSLFMA